MNAEREAEMSSNMPQEEDGEAQTPMNEPAGVRHLDQPAPAEPEPERSETEAEKEETLDRADEPVSKSPVIEDRDPATQEQEMARSTPTAGIPDEEPDLWAGLDDYRHRFGEIQAEFIEEPQAAVKKAEELVEEVVERVVKSLHDWMNTIHSSLGDGTDDTERLRLAMRGYKHLIDAFGQTVDSHESRESHEPHESHEPRVA